jgi:hypothetical protein
MPVKIGIRNTSVVPVKTFRSVMPVKTGIHGFRLLPE